MKEESMVDEVDRKIIEEEWEVVSVDGIPYIYTKEERLFVTRMPSSTKVVQHIVDLHNASLLKEDSIFRVGDEVFSERFRKGRVIKIRSEAVTCWPVVVEFSSNGAVKLFTQQGWLGAASHTSSNITKLPSNKGANK